MASSIQIILGTILLYMAIVQGIPAKKQHFRAVKQVQQLGKTDFKNPTLLSARQLFKEPAQQLFKEPARQLFKKPARQLFKKPFKHTSLLSALKRGTELAIPQVKAGVAEKWIPPVARNLQQSTSQDDCQRVNEAMTELIEKLSVVMTVEDIRNTFQVLNKEGYDILDAEDREKVSCSMVSFAQNDILSEMNDAERKEFEDAMALFTMSIELMRSQMQGEGIENTPEYGAMEAAVNLYDILYEIGFIPQ